ncbi:Ff.00g072280.m01.CDS01 [Fusarium sp. VM40]|nr:Ff.00g072280.m01.CDS01 [Fusarium sp. VM40]
MLLQLGYLLDGPDAAGQILFPSDNQITIFASPESSFEFGSISAVTSETEPVVWGKTETVAPENIWANDRAVGMTRFDDGWGTAPGFKFRGNTEEPEEESVGNAKVAWTAGQNKLVDDVADGWNRMMMMMMMMMMITTYKSCYFVGEETNDKTEGSVTIIKHTSTRLLKETHPSRTLLATNVLRCIK